MASLGNRPAGTPQPVEQPTTAAVNHRVGPGLWYVHTDGTLYRLDAVPSLATLVGDPSTCVASIPRPVRDIVAALCAWVADEHEHAANREHEYRTARVEASSDPTRGH